MKKIFIVVLISALAISCKRKEELILIENTGYAQGSTFQIKYMSKDGKDYEKQIYDIFKAMDRSMSTYHENSLISQINRGDELAVDSLFTTVMDRSLQIAEETNGQFDPTVGVLVNLWGFGQSGRKKVDTATVDSVKQYTGFRNIRYRENRVSLPKGFKIDFNAIAQGFTVDVISGFLEDKGIVNYMVEVGGEVKAKGHNADGEIWRIGIDKPTEEITEGRRFQIIIALRNAALATSGNYRKFWIDEKTGLKYAHTIDPKTGFPARNRLLSASVIAPNAMDADAYATVCMVKGVSDAIAFLNQKEDIEAYLIYTNEDGEWVTYQTEGFGAYVVN